MHSNLLNEEYIILREKIQICDFFILFGIIIMYLKTTPLMVATYHSLFFNKKPYALQNNPFNVLQGFGSSFHFTILCLPTTSRTSSKRRKMSFSSPVSFKRVYHSILCTVGNQFIFFN